MAIDRTAYNALVDDDGSNLVGTVIQKTTWKDVVLDPVDAALLPRVTATASSATPTPNTDASDLYSLTAQAAAAAFVNPTGTPVNGQLLMVRIKDNGTARALTWGTAYAEGGVPLPSTTVVSKILTITFIYNTDNALNKWQCIAVAQESTIPAPPAPRVTATTSSATPTPNADTTDAYELTAQAAAAAFGNPAGTPVNFQKLLIRIKDNGTARALTWGSAYVAGGTALPSTTVLSKILTIGFIYNTANALNKWQCVGVAQEA